MHNTRRTLLARFAALFQRRLIVGGILGLATLALALAVAVSAARADSGPPASPAAVGTTLDQTVSITPHYTATFPWTIDKSVSPDSWNLFKGDSGTSTYTIHVTKGSPTYDAWFDGKICVTNGGAVATQGLSISVDLSMPPDDTPINTVSVNLGANTNLDPGEQVCYNYHIDVPAANIVPGHSYKVTANTTITNHSGSGGPGTHTTSTSASTTLPASPTLINDTINVDDTNGGSWAFSGTGSQSYSTTFVCNANEGTTNNTATIRETGQSDSASVTVSCYSLGVTKTAATSFTRTYTWNILKTADQSSLTLALNQSYIVNYSIAVGATHTDSAWAVSGSITVHNPAPMAATINSVADVISGVGGVTPSCGVTFPYSLAAGADLVCSYQSSLPDASTRTNTATATLQNYAYASDGSPTASGTTDFSGSASVDFSGATMTEVDKSVSVSDTLGGPLGTLTYNGTDGLQHTYTYSYTVGPYAVCGPHTINNTATFTTNDTGTTDSSSWTVNVDVPCNAGCSLTIGYWKTHAGFTGNNADMVTPLLPIWLGTANGAYSIQVTTASQAVNILNFQGSSSNGIYKLEGQLLAAKLNIASGADGTAISSTIAQADAFLASNPLAWSKLSKAQQSVVLGWATTLDNYNNGLIGPGHCSQ